MRELFYLSLSLIFLAASILILAYALTRLVDVYHYNRIIKAKADEVVKRVQLEGELDRRERIRRYTSRQNQKAWEIAKRQETRPVVPDRIQPVPGHRKARDL